MMMVMTLQMTRRKGGEREEKRKGKAQMKFRRGMMMIQPQPTSWSVALSWTLMRVSRQKARELLRPGGTPGGKVLYLLEDPRQQQQACIHTLCPAT
jgi:hypothetical protein